MGQKTYLNQRNPFIYNWTNLINSTPMTFSLPQNVLYPVALKWPSKRRMDPAPLLSLMAWLLHPTAIGAQCLAQNRTFKQANQRPSSYLQGYLPHYFYKTSVKPRHNCRFWKERWFKRMRNHPLEYAYHHVHNCCQNCCDCSCQRRLLSSV